MVGDNPNRLRKAVDRRGDLGARLADDHPPYKDLRGDWIISSEPGQRPFKVDA